MSIIGSEGPGGKRNGMRGASGQLNLGWSSCRPLALAEVYAFLIGWETSRSKECRQGTGGTLRAQRANTPRASRHGMGHALNRSVWRVLLPSDQRCSAQCDLTWAFQNRCGGWTRK